MAITLNRYSQVTETMQREAARVMGTIVAPGVDLDDQESGQGQ
ncbi:MAG: hypothetical protein ACYCYK_07585 [Candidatus Dormibacteria bacterium]